MEDIQSLDNQASMFPFVESRTKALQLTLRVANGLHVSFEVIEIGSEDRVHRLRVREIVGLEHVDQKMDGCLMSLILGEHRIEREPIAVEDLLSVSRPPFLEIVDHENIPVIERKEAPCRKTNLICVSVWNQLAAPIISSRRRTERGER